MIKACGYDYDAEEWIFIQVDENGVIQVASE